LQDLLIGAAAGCLAMLATAAADRLLEPLVDARQRRREHELREGSPHALAGPSFARRLLGRPLGEGEMRVARLAFSVAYGFGWGAVYAAARRRSPVLGRAWGLPFAVPFFVLCDGVIAPLLGLTPTLDRLPWQPSAKELANHAVWTAATDRLHRAGRRAVAA